MELDIKKTARRVKVAAPGERYWEMRKGEEWDDIQHCMAFSAI